jgi:hypothetical protein
MVSLLQKAFKLSIALGLIASGFCLFTYSNVRFILPALFCGFLGFVLCCCHIAFSQRADFKMASLPLLFLSLLLNSSPLLLMLAVLLHHR